jgi:hypothetical protein
MSQSEFLRLAGESLGLTAKQSYLEKGCEVESSLIRDDDVVFITAGEPFCLSQGAKDSDDNTSSKFPTHSVGKTPHKHKTYLLPQVRSIPARSCGYDTTKPHAAVMGPGSVGKSALTIQYVQGVFIRDYDPTIEDAYRKTTTVDGSACLLDILDTAGQEVRYISVFLRPVRCLLSTSCHTQDYTALRATWLRERDGFLLVFSVIDATTFRCVFLFVRVKCVPPHVRHRFLHPAQGFELLF